MRNHEIDVDIIKIFVLKEISIEHYAATAANA